MIETTLMKSTAKFRKTLSIVTAIILIVCSSIGGANDDPQPDRDSKQQYFSTQHQSTRGLSTSRSDSVSDPIVEWPLFYGHQQTGMINTMYDCFGIFGSKFSRSPEPIPPSVASFATPPDAPVRYLWGGCLWIGGIVNGDTLVSEGVDGWARYSQEFNPPGPYPTPSISRFSHAADFSLNCLFSDTILEGVQYGPEPDGRPHMPLGIRVSNRSHIWRSSPASNVIVYDMVITNIGNQFIEQGFVGLYIDCDIHDTLNSGGYTDDIVGSIPEHGIAYQIDNDGDLSLADEERRVPKAFAMKLMASESSLDSIALNLNWWVTGDDWGPQQLWNTRVYESGGTGPPPKDSDKYYLMSFPEWDLDAVRVSSIRPDDSVWQMPPQPGISNWPSIDARFLYSAGPFDLLPDSSVRFQYAFLTADSVHTDPTNLQYLPDNPDTYLANLGLDRIIESGRIADSLAALLRNPRLPVAGFRQQFEDNDSVVIEWDPWVYRTDARGNEGIDGFEVYLSEVPSESFPYPGLVPPWLRPVSYDLIASVGRQHRFTLDMLQPSRFYFVNIAHRGTDWEGEPGDPLVVSTGERASSPVMRDSYVIIDNAERATIAWSPPDNADIDHYNIYRITLADQPHYRYHPFYDLGWAADTIPPVDSFFINDTTYYYHAMNVYAQVDSGQTSYTDPASLSEALYFVSAVDKNGMETEFSEDIRSLETGPRDKDLLVITNSGRWVTYDSIMTFYHWTAIGLDYDLFNWIDSVPAGGCQSASCFDWHDFMPYRLVIIDESVPSDFLTSIASISLVEGLKRYVHSDGKLAIFGTVSGVNRPDYGPPVTDPVSDDFLRTYFGVDSVSHIGMGYYNPQLNPALIGSLVDSLYGFTEAEPTSSNWPPVAFDSLRYTFTTGFDIFWPPNTAPVVSTFTPAESTQVSYLFRSIYPDLSVAEGKPVGLINSIGSTETYLFGFHLWYMDYDDARQLLNFLLDRIPTDVSNEGLTLPRQFALEQNYPNPFNPDTKISYSLPRRAEVRLDIYNILGQHVRELLDEVKSAGDHAVSWDGRDDTGQPLASGLYLYRLKIEGYAESRKMLLLK